jgi:hypothetical protein
MLRLTSASVLKLSNFLHQVEGVSPEFLSVNKQPDQCVWGRLLAIDEGQSIKTDLGFIGLYRLSVSVELTI